MPRINKVDLTQINLQIDKIDNLNKRIGLLENQVGNIGYQTAALDYVHAPSTTNNLVFTWTGSTGKLSWTQGFIQDKNASQTTQTTYGPKISSAPSIPHTSNVAAGSLSASASTYYWLGWDTSQQQMALSINASVLHQNFNVLIICQVYTGTAGQTGVAGGGGSRGGGSDLSGLSYKNF